MSKISKYDVLSLLAKKMPFYGATQWLKLPNEALSNKSPSELMKEDRIQEVYEALLKDINKGK